MRTAFVNWWRGLDRRLQVTAIFLAGSAIFFAACWVPVLLDPQARAAAPKTIAFVAASAGVSVGTAGLVGLVCVTPLVIFLLNIALLIWVARDARARGVDGALWVCLVLFTGPLGLVIYLAQRPAGLLSLCDSCNNWMLDSARRCPHCQAAT